MSRPAGSVPVFCLLAMLAVPAPSAWDPHDTALEPLRRLEFPFYPNGKPPALENSRRRLRQFVEEFQDPDYFHVPYAAETPEKKPDYFNESGDWPETFSALYSLSPGCDGVCAVMAYFPNPEGPGYLKHLYVFDARGQLIATRREAPAANHCGSRRVTRITNYFFSPGMKPLDFDDRYLNDFGRDLNAGKSAAAWCAIPGTEPWPIFSDWAEMAAKLGLPPPPPLKDKRRVGDDWEGGLIWNARPKVLPVSLANDPSLKVTLYRINSVPGGERPADPDSEQWIGGYRVIDSAPVKDRALADRLIGVVNDPWSYGFNALGCFDPGVAVKIEAADFQKELVLCLHCRYLHLPGTREGRRVLSERGRDELLDIYNRVYPNHPIHFPK